MLSKHVRYIVVDMGRDYGRLTGRHRMCGIAGKDNPAFAMIPFLGLPYAISVRADVCALGHPLDGRAERLDECLSDLLYQLKAFYGRILFRLNISRYTEKGLKLPRFGVGSRSDIKRCSKVVMSNFTPSLRGYKSLLKYEAVISAVWMYSNVHEIAKPIL